MAISIDWDTQIIYVPKADLTLISGTLYEFDLNQFHLDLKDLEDDEDGMPFPDTHRHETETTLSGVIYARKIEIINGYMIEFEDGQYTVSCIGANHNVGDVKVPNQVSLIINNSAGLQTVVSGSGVTEQDKVDIAGKVRDIVVDTSGSTTLQQAIFAILGALCGIATGGGTTQIEFRNQGNTANALILTVDENGNRTATTIGTP